MDTILQLNPWHWLILALVLFAIETLGTGGFLLGVVCASVVTSILAWFGMDWQGQVVAFSVLSVAFSFAYWKYFRNFNLQRETEEVVNDKMESLVGRTGSVVTTDSPNSGKIQVGDTLWECQFEGEIQEGEKVRVASYQGMTLHVERL